MGSFTLVIEGATYVNPFTDRCPGLSIQQDLVSRYEATEPAPLPEDYRPYTAGNILCKAWTYDFRIICLFCHAPLRFLDPATGGLIDPVDAATRIDRGIPSLELKYQKHEWLYKAGRYTELAASLGHEYEAALQAGKYDELRAMLVKAACGLEPEVDGDDLSDGEGIVPRVAAPATAPGSGMGSGSGSGSGAGTSGSGPGLPAGLPAPMNGHNFRAFQFNEGLNNLPMSTPLMPRTGQLAPIGGYDVFGGYNVYGNGNGFPGNAMAGPSRIPMEEQKPFAFPSSPLTVLPEAPPLNPGLGGVYGGRFSDNDSDAVSRSDSASSSSSYSKPKPAKAEPRSPRKRH